MNLLKTKFGFFFYLILQNRLIWSHLSKFEKDRIKKNNFYSNNYRPDYNPKDYQNNMSWDRFFKKKDYRKWSTFLAKHLKKKNLSILEIGPGSGYYTNFLCNHKNVSSYTFYEINKSFKNYLIYKLNNLSKKNFQFYSINKNFLKYKNYKKFDLIIFLSSFHHIPDRKDYFDTCCNLLKNNSGKIIFIEPTHYFFRIVAIIKKFFKYYIYEDMNKLYQNLCTHHFCTEAEFINLSKKKNLDINIEYKVFSKKVNLLLETYNLKFLSKIIKKYFSGELYFVCEKKI
jgi:SAM-dependent methyltransferase